MSVGTVTVFSFIYFTKPPHLLSSRSAQLVLVLTKTQPEDASDKQMALKCTDYRASSFEREASRYDQTKNP